MPGHEVASLVVALLLTATVLDLVLSAGLGLFFDLAFVTLTAFAGIAVCARAAYGIAFLPPLTMLGVMILVALTHRSAIARPDDGYLQAVIAGLSGHAIALGCGYLLCLGALAARRSSAAGR